MAKKTAETQVAADFQIWSKNWMYSKYVDANMASSYSLTCL